MTHLWHTGPGEHDYTELHINATDITLWQHRHGDISSVTINHKTALEIAAHINKHCNRNN